MPYDPDREVDPAKLRTFMERVKVGEPDLYRRAFRRLCSLTGRDIDDPLEAQFDACVAALEQIYWEESGKHKRARRITDKRGRDGTVETFRYLAMKRDPSDGFRHLVDNGLAEFTAEHVVVRYHDRFSAEAVECARRRLADFGIEVPREAAVSDMAGVGNQDA